MNKQILNLIFDLGNVIIPIDESLSREALYELLGPDSLEGFEREAFYDFERGHMSAEAMINHLQRLSRNDIPSPSDLIEAWNRMLFEIPPHRMEMLEELCHKYQVFILSNTNHFHLSWVRSHLQDKFNTEDFAGKHAHQAFYSHEIGHRKPDADVFDYVLRKAHIKANESLFFDDKSENIIGAIDSGLWAYQVRPDDEITEIIQDLSL